MGSDRRALKTALLTHRRPSLGRPQARSGRRISFSNGRRGHRIAGRVGAEDNPRRDLVHTFHAERLFFCIAAAKFFEYRKWVVELKLLDPGIFAELDNFEADAKAMRENGAEQHLLEAANFSQGAPLPPPTANRQRCERTGIGSDIAAQAVDPVQPYQGLS